MGNINRWYLIAIIALLAIIATSLVVPSYLMTNNEFEFFLIMSVVAAVVIGIIGAIMSKAK
jgi:hypothetical protein